MAVARGQELGARTALGRPAVRRLWVGRCERSVRGGVGTRQHRTELGGRAPVDHWLRRLAPRRAGVAPPPAPAGGAAPLAEAAPGGATPPPPRPPRAPP